MLCLLQALHWYIAMSHTGTEQCLAEYGGAV